VILEPVMKVEVVTPEQFFGDIMGDINSRRGLVLDTFDRGTAKVVSAHVPLSEMFGYATDMRSMTQGRASYSMEPSHYAKLPKNVADEVVAERAGGK
jgi:elongation factor G